MSHFREQVATAVVGILREVESIKTIRRTQPTVKEVGGFHSEDFPAVAITDRGFTSEHVRRHPLKDIVAKHTKLRIGITIYVQYSASSETELNGLAADIVLELEAQQDLGIDGVFIDDFTPDPPAEGEEPGVATVHTEMNIMTGSCLSGQRAPFPPVFAETMDVEVLVYHTSNVF